ncbi:spore protein [Vulcanibacillus modesticaldus]|uniref:Spore protein n=1 Tax=Vulcanibacillus modesticaldus TaxID=337097 RepID=A0A1D2YU81_9BACI|nr:small acid-soluble spore protein K [Vulcanibacillus modesticaldus]OEF99268.1 spore protein [Vulcanibacillus modesticaldus]
MRNKAKNFPGPRKIANPRAKTTALRPDGSINIDPKERLQENR